MHWKSDFLVLVASSLFVTLICISSADAQSTKLTVVTNLGVPAVLAEPDPLGPRSHIGIVTMHRTVIICPAAIVFRLLNVVIALSA